MAEATKHGESGLGEGIVNEERRRAAELHRTELARRRQSLDLQRENILSQRTSNPGRRTALEAALKQIEAQIAALG
jgi:multidrug efflux pump subunit AcrA (membrane-fusion protein)